ncbi:MAG: prepilin-type N-terminal cleavage/methylation domain-containing protein [Deltaproteobacteria bacterium]|nr:prepilin-type N-terminal cleavage/methylation domain-containing protein [Deltaproteobacteria bacterium]
MQASFDTTKSPDRGFTLVELLVVMLIAGVLLAGFTAFYLSQQRALRHHQIEVDLSQALRTALEQMSRELRSARKDVTRDFVANTGGAQPTFLAWTATEVQFELDANDDGDKTDAGEHRGFRLNGSSVEQYDDTTNTWVALAGFANGLTLTYLACDGTTATGADAIATVGISLTMQQSQPVGGLPVSRTETEQVRLRNVRCS